MNPDVVEIAGARRDRGVISLQVLAATMVVVVAVTGLLALGVPERLGCEIGNAVTSTTDHTTTPDPCDEPSTTRPAAATAAKADPLAGTSGSGALTGRTLAATDSVASPAIRDAQTTTPAVKLPPEYARCAGAPDDPARTGHPGTAICLAGTDTSPDGNTFTGSDLVLRCAASPDPIATPATATPETSTVCAPTDNDPWATLRTGPNDSGVRFCQPLRVDRTAARAPKSPFRVDWACASWAGNLHHCSNVLSSDVITTARSNGLVNYTEPTTWVTDPDYRQTWPTTCASRTFGTDLLACTPNKSTNTAACDIRGFQGLHTRPATCAYFHPTAGEDPTRSNTLNKPMHCRLTSTPESTTASITVDTPCPTTRRTLQADTTVGQVVCAAPQRPTGRPGQAWAAASTNLLSVPQHTLTTSTIEATPFGPGGVAEPVTTTQFSLAHQLTATNIWGGIAIPSTIFHNGPAQWVALEGSDLQEHDVLLVPMNATAHQIHQPFATWLAHDLGLPSSGPMHTAWVDLVVEILISMDTGQAVPAPPATLNGQLTASQLLTHATHLIAQAGGPVAAFTFATHLVSTAGTSLNGVVHNLAGAVNAVANVPGSTFTTQQQQSLAALVSMGTPLTQAQAQHAVGMAPAEGDAPAFWSPIAVPEIPDEQQTPMTTIDVDAVLVVEQPVQEGGLVCLALLPTLCGTP